MDKSETADGFAKIETTIRFYEELSDLVKGHPGKQDVRNLHYGIRSVKDLIESFGVPHVEVDMILVNGESVGFGHIVENGDRISVYPVFERLNVAGLSKLRDIPLRDIRFVLDVHLGRLAKYLRLLGYDVDYGNSRDDDEIVRISNSEGRIILSCDRQMLKRSEVVRGMVIRSRNPVEQVAEVLGRLDFRDLADPFSRCMECNGRIFEIKEETEFREAFDELPPRVKTWCDELYICRGCGRVYWKGSHYEKMSDFVDDLLKMDDS